MAMAFGGKELVSDVSGTAGGPPRARGAEQAPPRRDRRRQPLRIGAALQPLRIGAALH